MSGVTGIGWIMYGSWVLDLISFCETDIVVGHLHSNEHAFTAAYIACRVIYDIVPLCRNILSILNVHYYYCSIINILAAVKTKGKCHMDRTCLVSFLTPFPSLVRPDDARQ